MATRMQQRRGTAAQWLAADPVLAAGEMGFETDTNEFRIGDGVNVWSDLSPFKNLEDLGGSLDDYVLLTSKGVANGVASLNAQGQVPVSQLALVIAGAPAALDTLNEIAAALSNDSSYATTIINALDLKAGLGYVNTHKDATTSVHGIANTSLLATATTVATAKSEAIASAATAAGIEISTHASDTTAIHGIADTSLLATMTQVNTAVSTHEADTTSVHGIADTSLLATTANVATAKSEAIASAATAANGAADTKIDTHNLDTTSVHGIENTANLVVTSTLTAHTSASTSVHGIADTSLLATTANVATAKSEAIASAATAAGTALSTHEADTTNVHGISDTSALALTATVNSELALKANLASPTFTGTVSGITKSMVGLGSVDNTADADKPVSTAATTQLNLKAPLASPALTGVPTAPTAAAATNTTQVATTAYVRAEVAALVNSAGATLDTLGEIATALGNDANLSTTLTNAIALKAPLASPTFTGTNTVAALTASGLITASASGVAFTDGTQTKAGVPSITTFGSSFAATATLAAGEQDKFVPVAGTVVITLPASGYSTGQSIDFYQASGTGASFAATNSVVGTPGLKFRTTNSVVTAMKTSAGWLVFGDLSA